MLERDYGDREARELWPRLQRRLPDLFRNIAVTPALLHGDLHAGNTAETDDEPGNRATRPRQTTSQVTGKQPCNGETRPKQTTSQVTVKHGRNRRPAR